MMSNQDLYALFGVAKNASAEEIKSAFRKHALKHHPDRNPGDKQAEEKFKEYSRAYEILSDDEKRATYDRYGMDGLNGGAGFGGAGGADGFSDVFSDIFEDFFGGGGGRQRAQRAARGSDLGVEVELSFMEAVRGCDKKVPVRREEVCRTCAGQGAAPGTQKKVCTTCRGAGEVLRLAKRAGAVPAAAGLLPPRRRPGSPWMAVRSAAAFPQGSLTARNRRAVGRLNPPQSRSRFSLGRMSRPSFFMRIGIWNKELGVD
jgi:DnaJ-class molecular chaperone